MAYRLACELSGRIAAIAPVAASMSMKSCNPLRPVPVISFHSWLDTNVPYYGGIGSGTSDHYNSPQDSVLTAWAELNECAAGCDTITDNSQYTELSWSSCDCGAEIRQFITQDGGHSWPGGRQTAVGDPVSKYINADDLMWDFFKNYSLDCTPLSAERGNSKEARFRVFPNPAGSMIQVQADCGWDCLKVTIFNSQGKEVLSARDQALINISHLPDGILLVRIDCDNTFETHTILKIR